MADTQSERRPVLTPMSMVKPQRQRFLWNNRAPMGTCTIFAGRGGEGKSTYSLHVAAKLTRGELEGEYMGDPQGVLLIGHEDDLATIVAPRLIAASANTDLIFSFAVSVDDKAAGIEYTEVPDLSQDMARIRGAVEETGAKLIIVDPLTSMMGGANLDKTSDVRRALNPFMALAGELDVCVIAIMHVRKGAGDTRDLLSGSHAFRDAARSVIMFATDPDTEQRVGSVDKSNYSQATGESFAFNLITTAVQAGDEIATVARIHDLGASTISVSDIINREPDKALGEEIQTVVDCVNAHPEGIKPAEVTAETRMADNAVRNYLSRAARRGLIEKHSYGTYYPRATPAEPLTPDAPGAVVALNPSKERSAPRATVQQHYNADALCPIHGTPTHNGTCGRCEAAA